MKALDFSWIILACLSCYVQPGICDDLQPTEDFYNATTQIKARLLDPAVYDRTVRPMVSSTAPTEVHTIITLELISHVGLADEKLEMTFFFCMQWTDKRLSWDTWNVSGPVARSLMVPIAKIWEPEVTLINTDPGAFKIGTGEVAILMKHGDIHWCPAVTAEVPCTMDMSSFPYDAHDCTLHFASLAYTDREVNFTAELTAETVSNVSAEWTVRNVSYKRGKVLDQTTLDLTLRLQRTGGNYRYTVLLPSVAVTLVTLFVFWMPPTSDRRVTLGCLNLLTAMLMLTWMAWWLEASSTMPRIITFLGGATLIQAVVIAFSILALNMTSTSMPCRPPEILVHFMGGPVATFLCLSRPPVESSSDGILQSEDDDRQRAPKDDLVKQQEWYLVAQGLDRLLFVVFSIVLVAMLV